MNDECIRTFLIDSLELWGVDANVRTAERASLMTIVSSEGTLIRIERLASSERPFRWSVCSRKSEDAPGAEARSKRCVSLGGMLKALRAALGVDGGSPLRIAPSPQHSAQSSPRSRS